MWARSALCRRWCGTGRSSSADAHEYGSNRRLGHGGDYGSSGEDQTILSRGNFRSSGVVTQAYHTSWRLYAGLGITWKAPLLLGQSDDSVWFGTYCRPPVPLVQATGKRWWPVAHFGD